MAPDFLSLEDAILIHQDEIERYGGSPGIRSLDLLKSALAMPRAGAFGQYFHGSIFEMAAAYLFHVVMDHPFIDGNKRVGAMAAFVFLKLNGYTLRAPESKFEDLVMAVARGEKGKAEVSEFLRRSSRRSR